MTPVASDSTRVDDAACLAPSSSLRPSACATSAPPAIDMPRPTDRLENTMVPAKPMAAVASMMPSMVMNHRSIRSTRNIAIRPMALVKVITTTWFMVEPVVKRAPTFALSGSALSGSALSGSLT
jgi:hypothetical protein